MIALDTNVLVRLITQDDPVQAARVDSLLADMHKQRRPVFVSDVVLCELAWVLKDCYEQGPSEIAAVIERILSIPDFVFQEKDRLWASLRDYREGKAGFADHVVGRTGQSAGATKTYTFDRGLRGYERFEIL